MPFIVVTVEIDSREQIELSVPLNVPSRGLAATIMRELGKLVGTGEAFALFVKTARGEKRIPSAATLGEFGVVEGQRLRIRRESGGLASDPSRPHAYLQTRIGVVLALDANNVIVGRRDARAPATVDLDLSRYDPENSISRRHASIVRDGRKYGLIDLHSTNGTRLNGARCPTGEEGAARQRRCHRIRRGAVRDLHDRGGAQEGTRAAGDRQAPAQTHARSSRR